MTTSPLRATITAVGDDEARARATLNEMQRRISGGPYAALGITETATTDEVRTAFLALTKQFHPARFARLSPELHRMSNEVFLGIKSAHDQLLKQLGGARRGGTPTNQSGAIPVMQHPEGTGRAVFRNPGTSPGLARPAGTPIARAPERPSTPAISRTLTPAQAMPPRPATPPQGISPRPGAAQPVRPTTPTPGRTPAMGTPIIRPGTPPTTRPTTTPVTRAPAPPAPQNFNPDTIRHSGVPKTEPAFDERAALREALMFLNEQNWSPARQTLQTLVTRVPASKNYLALLAYARGREAQAAGRPQDAALEYQRALQIDPEMQMAKQALADVQRRR